MSKRFYRPSRRIGFGKFSEMTVVDAVENKAARDWMRWAIAKVEFKNVQVKNEIIYELKRFDQSVKNNNGVSRSSTTATKHGAAPLRDRERIRQYCDECFAALHGMSVEQYRQSPLYKRQESQDSGVTAEAEPVEK